MQRKLLELIICTSLCASTYLLGSDTQIEKNKTQINTQQKSKVEHHEIYISYLVAYAAAEYRFIYQPSKDLSWYLATGLDGAIHYGSAHISSGLHSKLDNLYIYTGLGAVYGGIHRNSKDKIAPIAEFKIVHSLNSNTHIQWFGIGVGDQVSYWQLPGIVLKF